MGVPKFFRYISERYPCLTELLKEYQIPEFDNLYLDMNGIIHMCSHPDDYDPHFRITEEKIFADIFHYIEVLFRMIKPHKLFFMAIDGVAPRAKMNQQRGRRFRTAKEAEKLEQKAREKGEALPEQSRFDSNCITPGTVFMAKLHEQLKYFIVNKISTDPLWQNCKIILSGHETPGEGEHKIMDYIRYLRAQPGHDPNTRHCLYGLDADLMMLGLCTHEPHFSLLREEVKFGKKGNQKRKNVPEQITFYLLHLSLMREYLEQEFISLKDNLSFGYNIESIIDDWVLMGFLVGNDFIPHLPNLHIANGALPLLYNAYMKVLPTFDGYINENGILNLERFEKFMAALCCIDMEHFSEQYADLKYFEGKTGRRPNDRERTSYKPKKLEEWHAEDGDEGMFAALEGEEVKPMQSDLAALIKATEDMFVEPSEANLSTLADETEDNDSEALEYESESCSEDDLLDAEFKLHKKDYYMNKLQYAQVTPEVMRAQAEGYVRAIQWNLHYYYNGVCSWSWYYEHHYAPFISDIKDFKNFKIDFDLGTPFKPYEQLLGVLPTASKKFLPECYHRLMEDPSSPIFDYYPTNFNTDLNGKKQDWEAVVLIPFIDEKRLLAAMATCNHELSDEEVKRNTHGPMLVYEYTTNDLQEYEAPEYFPAVKNNHALCTLISNEDIRVPADKLVKSIYPGALFDVYYPGFPTTKHLKYKSYLKKGGVKVFDQPSRGETLYLEILPKPVQAPEIIAKELLGEIVFVSWPHLVEALVVTISTQDYRYHATNVPGEYNVEHNKGNLAHNWQIEKNGIIEFYRDKKGVDVGDTSIMVHCKLMTGRKYVFTSQGRINLEKQWADTTNPYPLQTVIHNITQHNPTFKPYHNIEDVFTVGSTCFMLGLPHYGFEGKIEDSKETLKKGRVKIALTVQDEPNFRTMYQLEEKLATSYIPVHIAATSTQLSKRLFSRITGAIFVLTGPKRDGLMEDAPKHNIGLNLKFNKKNEEIPGYTKKDYSWLYSYKAIDLVQSYYLKYPKMFQFLETKNNDVYYEYELFPEDNGSGETVKEIVNWLKSQEYFSIERQQCGSTRIEPDVVKHLEKIIDEHQSKNHVDDTVVMQVKPFLLYKPGLLMGNVPPDPKVTFQLYDRVVSVRESYTVPLGHVGTIIAIHKSVTGKPEDFLYDIFFDKPFAGGMALNCPPQRGYKMSRLSLINRTHGAREMEMKTGKPGQLYQKIGYSQSPAAGGGGSGSQQKFNNSNQNSAFAAWNNQSPQHKQGGAPVDRPKVTEDAQSMQRNSNSKRSSKKAKEVSSQNHNDFMPGFVRGGSNNEQQATKSEKSNKQAQSQPKLVLQREKQTRQLDETPKAESVQSNVQKDTASSSVPSTGTSLTANDLFAHVSAQMQKMSISTPPAATLPFGPPPSEPPGNLAFPSVAPTMPPVTSLPMPAIPANLGFGHQLLNECQRRGLGCPLYHYFHDQRTQLYQVQLKLPFLEQPIVGTPAPTKQEASESAAELGLQKCAVHAPPMQFPAPPVQWCRPPPMSQYVPRPPQSQAQRQAALAQGAPLQMQMRPRMQAPPPVMHLQQMQFQQQMQHLHQQQLTQPPPRPAAAAAQPPQGNKQMQSTVPFVPLQAVRQQRNRNSNSNSSQPSAKKNAARRNEENRGGQQGPGGQEKSPRAGKEDRETRDGRKKDEHAGKPRRERKTRIAANFSVQP